MSTTPQLTINWPPPYLLKRNRKARSMILKISHETGLEITIPYYCSKKEALQFLESRKTWIMQHAEIIYRDRSFQFPQHIDLLAIHKKWQIKYINSQKRHSLSQPQPDVLIYKGSKDARTFQRIMKNWLKKQAEVAITPQLDHLSKLLKLPYKQVQYHFQKSRWGSCDIETNITLNSKLLFVSSKLLRYVIIHELSHIKHFNHSAEFWDMVSNYEPCYKQCIKTLKQQDALIPAWIITKQIDDLT